MPTGHIASLLLFTSPETIMDSSYCKAISLNWVCSFILIFGWHVVWNWHICIVVVVDVHLKTNNTTIQWAAFNAKMFTSKDDSIIISINEFRFRSGNKTYPYQLRQIFTKFISLFTILTTDRLTTGGTGSILHENGDGAHKIRHCGEIEPRIEALQGRRHGC